MKRYQMTASRYFPQIGYIKASPELPYIIELDDSIKPGPDMREIDKDGNIAGGPLIPAQFAVSFGGSEKNDAATRPFDATEKRASGQWDGLEYREEGKRVKDSTPNAEQQIVSVERVNDAPKGEDFGAADKDHKNKARASDKKVL